MYTIKEITDGISNIDETELAKICDKLRGIGSLEEIKKNVSPELFYLYVGINIIGNWKCEGWWFLICEQADFVPYIPVALEELHLPELKKAFENIIKIFPEYTVFRSDDSAYYDICNFLQSAHFKVCDERLNCIDLKKRKEMVKQIHKNLNILEDLTKPFFGDSSECGGWKYILDFIASKSE